MQIIVTGATGFIGMHLVPELLRLQHRVFVVGRSLTKIQTVFGDSVVPLTWDTLEQILPDDVDAVINLAGENIGNNSWNDEKKLKIKTSRITATTKIANWAIHNQYKKPHIYNASAIGIYGLALDDKATSPLTEFSPIAWNHPTDFLSEVGQAWENALQPATDAGIPTTFMRFAVVLECGQGMLKKLELPFSLGLGSILGNGNQALTWIHIEDLIAAIIFLLNHPGIIGPINVCSPESISQKRFAKTLARAMNRPLIVRLPDFLIKILFGQMGNELLLKGQCVIPTRLNEVGFKFKYADLNALFLYLKDNYSKTQGQKRQ